MFYHSPYYHSVSQKILPFKFSDTKFSYISYFLQAWYIFGLSRASWFLHSCNAWLLSSSPRDFPRSHISSSPVHLPFSQLYSQKSLQNSLAIQQVCFKGEGYKIVVVICPFACKNIHVYIYMFKNLGLNPALWRQSDLLFISPRWAISNTKFSSVPFSETVYFRDIARKVSRSLQNSQDKIKYFCQS
jgi:hypothetical protein